MKAKGIGETLLHPDTADAERAAPHIEVHAVPHVSRQHLLTAEEIAGSPAAAAAPRRRVGRAYYSTLRRGISPPSQERTALT